MTSVWLFKPRSHGRKKEGARARNGAPLPGGGYQVFACPIDRRLLVDNHHATHAFDANFRRIFTFHYAASRRARAYSETLMTSSYNHRRSWRSVIIKKKK